MIDLGELQACETKEQVESCFLKYNITDFSEKRSLLLDVMGNPPMFNWSEDSEAESLYNSTLRVFVFGTWVLDHRGPCYNNNIDWNRRLHNALFNLAEEREKNKAMGIYDIDFSKAAEATVRDIGKLIPKEEPTTNECCGLTY